MYFAFKPYLYGLDYLKDNPEVMFDNLNSVLIFMGLGISFSSLQDTSKTQNELSKKIWQNPRKGKIAIIIISLFILILLTSGLTGFYFSETGILKDLSIGIIVLSLGMFGLLKAAIEMFENHRADKKINNI